MNGVWNGVLHAGRMPVGATQPSVSKHSTVSRPRAFSDSWEERWFLCADSLTPLLFLFISISFPK